MKSHFALSVAAAALFVARAAPAAGLDQLQAFLDATRTARGAFSQTVISRSGRKPQQSAGVFAMQRPGKFRWSYEIPYKQLLVGDGERLWSYDPELKQAVVKRMGQALGASPAALLAGGDLHAAFVLREGTAADGLEFVEATPKQTDAGFARMRIGLREQRPVVMEIDDNFGQKTVLRFTQFERNPPLDAALFQFKTPPGADLIGE